MMMEATPMIEPPVRKDPTDRERSWSYRSPLSKVLDVPFFLCSVVVPCALIFTDDDLIPRNASNRKTRVGKSAGSKTTRTTSL